MRRIQVIALAASLSAALSCGGNPVSPPPPPPPQAPTIASVAPTFGPFGGGTTVTISGANFVAGAGVRIGTAAATNVTVTSPTSLTAVTGAVALPVTAVDVTVTNPNALVGTLAGGFQYRGVIANAGPLTGTEYTGNTTRNIQVNGTRSFAVPPIAAFRWNCGQTPPGPSCLQTGATPNLIYTRPGALNASPLTYTATLEVEDTLGNKATATATVRVSQLY